MADEFSTEDEQYMIDTLKNFFAEEEWKCDFDEEQKIFSGSIALDGPLSSVRFYVVIHDDCMICYHISPIAADPECRNRMAEYLTRANLNLNRGCFELDFDDGEIRYKHRLSLADVREDGFDGLWWMMFLGSRMFEKHSKSMLSVSFGLQTPEEAFLSYQQSQEQEEQNRE